MSRFERLMQENITIRRLTGTSSTGGKTYAPEEIIKGRLEWQRRKVLNDKGEEALSEAAVYTTARLKPGDLVLVDGRSWPVKAVTQRKGLYSAQADHWEVRL